MDSIARMNRALYRIRLLKEALRRSRTALSILEDIEQTLLNECEAAKARNRRAEDQF